MDSIINLAGKIFGVNGAILGALNGAKTYIGGVTKLLTGVAGMLVAIVNILGEVQNLHTLSDVVHFGQGAFHGQDPFVIAFTVALAVAGSGLQGIGQAHKGDKLLAAVQGAAPAATPPTP